MRVETLKSAKKKIKIETLLSAPASAASHQHGYKIKTPLCAAAGAASHQHGL
jgi:hypothetical protein